MHPNHDQRGLIAANQERTLTAAERTVADAQRVLAEHPYSLTTDQRRVLTARVTFPSHTLAQLAATLGIGKDSYAGILRRTLARHAAQ